MYEEEKELGIRFMMVIKIMLLNQPDGQHGKHLHEVVNLHQGTGKKKLTGNGNPCVFLGRMTNTVKFSDLPKLICESDKIPM